MRLEQKHAYLINDDSENKKAKETKKFDLCLRIIKIFFLMTKSIKLQQSDHHVMYTEEVHKIALSSNDDKRFQIFDGDTTYPHGTNVFKVCEIEMMIARDLFFESYAN